MRGIAEFLIRSPRSQLRIIKKQRREQQATPPTRKPLDEAFRQTGHPSFKAVDFKAKCNTLNVQQGVLGTPLHKGKCDISSKAGSFKSNLKHVTLHSISTKSTRQGHDKPSIFDSFDPYLVLARIYFIVDLNFQEDPQLHFIIPIALPGADFDIGKIPLAISFQRIKNFLRRSLRQRQLEFLVPSNLAGKK